MAQSGVMLSPPFFILHFSPQVDQEVLAALPSDIRDEYQRVFDDHKKNKKQKEKQQQQGEATGPLDTMSAVWLAELFFPPHVTHFCVCVCARV